MKKILLATLLLAPIAAFAQTGNVIGGETSTATTTPVIATTTPATTTQVVCIQNALEKRENALITGHDAFNTAIKTALQNRLTGLKAAYAMTDKKSRQEKRNATHKTFKTETQAAHTGMKTARQVAWRTFDTEMRACGVRGHGEAPHTVAFPTFSL